MTARTTTAAICPYSEMPVTSSPDEGIFTPIYGGPASDTSKNPFDSLRDSGFTDGVEICAGDYILFKANCDGEPARIMSVTLEVQYVQKVTILLLGTSEVQLGGDEVCTILINRMQLKSALLNIISYVSMVFTNDNNFPKTIKI